MIHLHVSNLTQKMRTSKAFTATLSHVLKWLGFDWFSTIILHYFEKQPLHASDM